MDNCSHGIDIRNPCETCNLREQVDELEAVLAKAKKKLATLESVTAQRNDAQKALADAHPVLARLLETQGLFEAWKTAVIKAVFFKEPAAPATLDDVTREIGNIYDAYASASAELAGMRIERDAALAEVARLTRILPPGGDRAEGAPGEGTWSVFAEKAVKERDEWKLAFDDVKNNLRLYAERIKGLEALVKEQDVRVKAAEKERDILRATLTKLGEIIDAFRTGSSG